MRSPERVLNSLFEHGQVSNYKFERLYRILFNEEMFYVAYQRIYAKPGNMTQGTDGKTIDQMSLTRLEKLINSLKDESYQPQPSRRVYIPKKNGKMRPLGVPAFDDKLVQEVIRMILEAIYEESFEYTSHGFRPNRSCHTALAQIQKSFCGAKWFIEGDIKGFFDNINHDVLINTLKERISDDRFIRIIRKFLNAGYVEDWKFHKTYSGTPQGGIISPMLANIYLDKLDKYMKEYIQNFDKGKGRKRNEQSVSLGYKRRWIVEKLKVVRNEAEKAELIKRFKANKRESILFSSGDEMDENYKRLKYVRYADDFLIGIIGSKQDAIIIKENIKNFLIEKLALELSDEKTLITHTDKSAKFLGYEIDVMKSDTTKRSNNGALRRAFNKRVRLMIGKDMIKNKLLEHRVLEIKIHNGKEQWKPKSRSRLTVIDDLEILEKYNQEIRGLINYYSLANNAHELQSFGYIMQYSMYKTFAHKYRTKVTQILKKYHKDGHFTVNYQLRSGAVKSSLFYHDGYKRKDPMRNINIDNLPNIVKYTVSTSLVERLKAEKCELCGATDKLIMHHVRKLGELKGKQPWEKLMIARRRKTIALCGSCHRKTHLGCID
ncbi:group II intron reverse transcriptase/maturase [Dysgonomonas sp. ZJ709]|uniref:group II intron reverse transcriptase/maturase n=1 Tax=Dysgonomonas sp. ZJ709 TaxID=2709797 RepID=UPI0013EB1354|nr:group II intron reverse transcriptase/maturase [Dysgonomonas sp. ZJ709]